MLRFELSKITGRRFSFIGLLGIGIVFPILLSVLAQLHVVKDHVPEGLFLPHTKWAIISYACIYFFLPLMVIVFVGQELVAGHASRVAFIRSRSYYFRGKIVYTIIISLIFSLIEVLTLFLNVESAPFTNLTIGPSTFFNFFVQAFLTNQFLSLFLLALTFIFRNPVVTFVTFFLLEIVERIAFAFANGLYDVTLFFTPLHLTRLFYSRDGSGSMDSYYTLAESFNIKILITVVFIFTILYLAYVRFSRSDLKALSD